MSKVPKTLAGRRWVLEAISSAHKAKSISAPVHSIHRYYRHSKQAANDHCLIPHIQLVLFARQQKRVELSFGVHTLGRRSGMRFLVEELRNRVLVGETVERGSCSHYYWEQPMIGQSMG